jgi:hypothetical protein
MPNTTELLGGALTAQGVAADTLSTLPFGVTLTNGLEMVIGR